jgi:hypothetical protein
MLGVGDSKLSEIKSQNFSLDDASLTSSLKYNLSLYTEITLPFIGLKVFDLSGRMVYVNSVSSYSEATNLCNSCLQDYIFITCSVKTVSNTIQGRFMIP